MSRRIKFIGKINDDGYPFFTEKGFVYSFTNNNPKIDDLNHSIKVSVNGYTNEQTKEFSTHISNLPETTIFYVNSYAINTLGVVYGTPLSGITGGIINKPTVQLKTLKSSNDEMLEVYEVGTVNQLVISGTTTKNDELTFNTLTIIQNSPPPLGNPVIRTWYGLTLAFRTDEAPITNINFSPNIADPKSYPMIHTANYLCGQPEYTVSASTQVDAVFPYLWVMNPTSFDITNTNNIRNFCAATGPYANTLNYFYYKAASPPNLNNPINGKIVVKKITDINGYAITISTSSSNNKLLFGYPSDYGEVEIKIDDSNWYSSVFNPNMIVKDVNVTTSNGNSSPVFQIDNHWTYRYNIIRYHFSGQYGKRTLYFKHV